jgi:hypothetical protein
MDADAVHAAIRQAVADALIASNARSDALELANTELRDRLLALAAAPAVPAPLDAAALGAAIASNLSRSADHSRDLEKFPTWSGEEVGANFLPPEDYLANLTAKFDAKRTPDADRVSLAVEQLRGKALNTFKAYTNRAGNTGDRASTTWVEYQALIRTLAPDVAVESQRIERLYDSASQKASAEKFVELYKSLVAQIHANAESQTMHTQASLIKKFVIKLKPSVQVHLLDRKFSSLEEAYSAAIRADNLVFAALRPPSSPGATPPRKAPTSTPSPWGSRGPSPGPPAHISALLASLGFNPDGSQIPGGPTAPSSSPSPPPTLGALEKDHSVPEGATIPKMTPEIRAWCVKWRACFRCRVKNATHPAANCPRFKGVPDRPLSSVEEELEGQGNG